MEIFLGLIIYLVIFSISILCYTLSKRITISKFTRIFLLFCSIITVVLFSGLRYFVGTDYIVYLGMQSSDKWGSIITFTTYKQLEYGYFIINYIGSLTNSLSVTLTLASGITMVFLLLGLKKFNINNTIAYAIVLLTFFPVNLNLVRQSMAMAIVFYALSFLYKKHYLKFFFLVLLASTFHFTAILMLVLIFFDPRIYDIGKKFRIKKYIIPLLLLFLTALIVINFNFIVTYLTSNPYFSHYSYLVSSERVGQNRDIILNGILIGIILVFGFKLFKNDDSIKALLFILVFGFILSFTGKQMLYAKRISMYMDLIYIVLIIKVIYSFNKTIWKKLFLGGYITYAVIRFIIMYYYLGNAEIIPYVYRMFW